ncbi:AraC family transcriptional regulator [Rhodoferax sp. AJA081-3]|uniref:helix-turn-helix domain-containing protein n=1 Tax=Rhodoferax sp. AJA081-3 TaxID=2752316 RepID=UPI001AE02AB6|nr:AraC family transcriptional regulator [Rhodoferax sp. AJA081-3]QTN27023.1 AraC family transcriptional regulator [Rhodoferax sp. AJA081-3]
MASPSTNTIAFDPALWPSGTLWQPRASLSACVRASMVRNTLGADHTDAQRVNHFPASPMCSLSWWFSGSSQCLNSPPAVAAEGVFGETMPMPGRWVLCGPQTRPVSTWCPGPVHSMMVLVMPDALHALTGLQVSDLIDQFFDASTILPPDWLPMLQQVQDAPDDAQRLQALEEFLEPRWQRYRPSQPLVQQRYSDWVAHLALRAAVSAPGRSLRQLERRIKQWSGLPLRELRVMGRSEEAFLMTAALATQTTAKLDWAQIAVDTGYSDQSHLIRTTRRITGFTPDALGKGIQQQESFWAYRLWM